MANLSKSEALNLIKNPKNSLELSKARQKRIRNRLHAQTDVKLEGFSNLTEAHHVNFLKWVESVLESKESFDRYKKLYIPPVPTNELLDDIFAEHEKVFHAQDRVINVDFENVTLKVDADMYLKRIGDEIFWRTAGFSEYKNSIDNVLVVDLPVESENDEINPYYYFVDIDHIIDIVNTKVLFDADDMDERYLFNTEYIIFRRGILTIVIDDEFYRVFEGEGNKLRMTSENPHFLGYAPAKSFWTTPLNDETTIRKKNQVINSLSELDWLLFFEYSKKYLDLYASFPIYSVYKTKCNYIDIDTTQPCVNGYITYNERRGDKDVPQKKKCPKCSTAVKVGPGQVLEFGAPQDKDDPDLLRNPVKIIGAEETSLKYVQGEVMRLESDIYRNATGAEREEDNSQAKNEDQIKKGLEAKSSIYLSIAQNFEIIHSWALTTIFKLRYGRDVEMSVGVNYGTNFFKTTREDLITHLKEAKEAGLTSYEIHGKKMSIYGDMFKNNPDKLTRIKILSELDPFPDVNVDEVLEWQSKGAAIDPKDLLKKIHFTQLIQKFEREQTGISVFASKLEFDKRIDAINVVLDGYLDDMMPEESGTGGVGDRDDIEAIAKAKLKGSVGGVQGLIAIQQSVVAGTTTRSAAISMMFEIFGFDEQTAIKMLT